MSGIKYDEAVAVAPGLGSAILGLLSPADLQPLKPREEPRMNTLLSRQSLRSIRYLKIFFGA
jgi:hypothetical protein